MHPVEKRKVNFGTNMEYRFLKRRNRGVAKAFDSDLFEQRCVRIIPSEIGRYKSHPLIELLQNPKKVERGY